jgi:hypothetical protein
MREVGQLLGPERVDRGLEPGTAGGFNIAGCEIGQDPITKLWEDDNSG